MKTGKRLFILLAVICVIAPAVQAADFSVGGGIGIAPDYEGSEDYKPVPVPVADVKYSNGMFVKLFGLNLKANLLPSSMWQIGPVYNYRMERKDVKNNAVDDMKTVDGTSELGVFGGLTYQKWFASIELLSDMGDGHDGWYSKLSGGYNWVIDENWILSIGAFTTYADDDYMQTYFGVSRKDARRSGLDRYNADAGIKDMGINLGANWKITQNWSARGVVVYTQLLGDASDDSPVVDEGSESQFFTAVMGVYSF
jgi:outer membrane scaffolding protein for murein synthesis (MipA/OmpV family)